MNKIKLNLSIMIAVIVFNAPFTCSAQSYKQILDKIDVNRGICLVLDDRTCKVVVELAQHSELLIYLQLQKAQDLEKACSIVDQAGFYGTRIFVEQGPLSLIHLADNTADAAVVPDNLPKEAEKEILRVLRPGGKAVMGPDKILVKPLIEGTDDWSHPYHGPDNNPQSEDTVIRAPYLTQFLAEPRYAPLPQVAIASAGRIFKAFGHVAFKKREEPFLNKLVAFNGYNGTMLWQRDLAEGVMIHRNTMIATPAILYIGDDKSCKLIDTVTGQLKDEIIPSAEQAGGTFWKWMGLENDILYALIGEQEQRDPTQRWNSQSHGWPWDPISIGFNQPNHPWGFGRNVLAIDPKTKKILWSYREDEPVDSRAMCMKNGRIYIFRFGEYLACLNVKDGSVIWRRTPENAPELFESLGEYSHRQDWRTNWRTTCYLKCSDKALYFAGPQVNKLVAVSTKDGGILWEHPYNNFQLVLRADGLYGLSGQIDEGNLSKKFDPLTGEVLADLVTGRRACTRPTGSIDGIFYRASGGSTRLDIADQRQDWISPMRAQCHDGVTIANGLLYWWPSVCDCQLTLYGITCLGPAGDFDFNQQATQESRLEKHTRNLNKIAELPQSSADWPTFRADNTGSAISEAIIPDKVKLLWSFDPETTTAAGVSIPTAPVTVGGLVFIGGPDGIVRAINAVNGQIRWKAYTGGAVRFPATIWNGRAFVGSGDGWVYAFEAKTGRLLWRFRAAPAERKIPVYGSLLSTWPVASGVLIEKGTAYFAAGIVNYDGTYVYAIDAKTGKIKWQNNTSGHLDQKARTGASVQGHQLLYNGKLYLASGTSLSPAVYNTSDGKCLNNPAILRQLVQNNLFISQSPRGCDLSLLGGQVVACGKPFYAHPKYEVFDDTVFNRVFLALTGNRNVFWVNRQNNRSIVCFDHIDKELLRRKMSQPDNRFNVDWQRLGVRGKQLWNYNCKESLAMAVCSNAVVVAEKSKVVALNIEDGTVIWSEDIPSAPVSWGIAVSREGHIIITLENGQILCFGQTMFAYNPGGA
ncbi:MAG: PQQ-binding-like beta-propeller repeat protein [Sedimentisphaerales bacterium]|nr:PQQ-binding-like beta-propeller repeat protein [Sedimentisphaerales bacterium]